MYLPEGRTSANIGVSLPIRTKSSRLKSTSAVRAIPIKCSTALVEPPSTITTLIAFSNADLVMMSLGLISSFKRFKTASPARVLSSCFSCDTASCADEPGKLMPSASMAEAMVLAVYIPPQEPGPGIATSSICFT